MLFRGTYRGDNAFSDSGNDGRFPGTANKTVNIGTNRNTGPNLKFNPILATAEINGVSMTFGLTLICTASRTSRPARSMAAARSKVRGWQPVPLQ